MNSTGMGKWIEHDGSDCPATEDKPVEVIFQGEQAEPMICPRPRTACWSGVVRWRYYQNRLDYAAGCCYGDNKEHFKKIIADRDEILARICDYARVKAKRKRVEPWSIIGDLTGHGSGVSSAIYEMYRRRTEDE